MSTDIACSECGCVNAEHHLQEELGRAEAALREAQAREAVLARALRGLVDAVDDDVGHEDDNYRPQSAQVQRAVDRADAALASPSAAAAELLRRVEELEADAAGWPQSGIQVVKTVLYHIGGEVEGKPTQTINYLQRLQALVAAEADRDRWLGHVRALVKLLETPEEMRGATWDGFFAARRDLEQHDGGTR